MTLNLPETGVIKQQAMQLSDDVVIIYGYNNCGKTSILKLITQLYDKQALEDFFHGQPFTLSLYIPTNRIVLSGAFTEMITFHDVEDILNYKKTLYDSYYEFHLKTIRDYLLPFEIVRDFIQAALHKMFALQLTDFSSRNSDGIENILNIYTNIIWILLWDQDLSTMTQEQFLKLLSTSHALLLIDEIEMFLHVSIQSKLIDCLKSDFPNCSFLFSTHSPLLLTRYRHAEIYRLENGLLHPIYDDLFFKDLDAIYESCFHVSELPQELITSIKYLGNIVLGKETPDQIKVASILKFIRNNYPNLYHKYTNLMVKAGDRAGL